MIEFMINSESWVAYLLWLILMLPVGFLAGIAIFWPVWEFVSKLLKKEKDDESEDWR